MLARRFAARGERGGTRFSAATGIIFLAGFAGISSGSQIALVDLAFAAAVVAAWAWLSAVLARARTRDV